MLWIKPPVKYPELAVRPVPVPVHSWYDARASHLVSVCVYVHKICYYTARIIHTWRNFDSLLAPEREFPPPPHPQHLLRVLARVSASINSHTYMITV